MFFVDFLYAISVQRESYASKVTFKLSQFHASIRIVFHCFINFAQNVKLLEPRVIYIPFPTYSTLFLTSFFWKYTKRIMRNWQINFLTTCNFKEIPNFISKCQKMLSSHCIKANIRSVIHHNVHITFENLFLEKNYHAFTDPIEKVYEKCSNWSISKYLTENSTKNLQWFIDWNIKENFN